MASVDDGWSSMGAIVAFPDHVGDAGVRVRASGDGGGPWVQINFIFSCSQDPEEVTVCGPAVTLTVRNV